MTKPTNPQAFPFVFMTEADGTKKQINTGGMTLRDYFAAHASAQDVEAYRTGPNNERISWVEAKYRYADEMLKARGQ